MMFDAYMGGFTKSQSVVANSGELQNWYLERLPQGSFSQWGHYPTPGFEQFGHVAQVGGRAFFSTAANNGRVFSVTGSKLYEWMADGSTIERGEVAINENPAVIATNGDGGNQLEITSGTNVYAFDLLTNTLTQVLTLDGKGTMVGFSGGYFLVFDIESGTVYQSNLFDGLVYDPLDFFQRSIQSDDWVALVVLPWGQLFLPGTQTRDNYYNSGTFPVPFAPAQSGIQPDGCAAPFSVKVVGKWVCWLGVAAQGGYNVYGTQGYESQLLSDESIAFALSRFNEADIARATAEAHTDQGHDFYLLYVGDTTFCFDFKTQQWHTRRTFTDAATGTLGPWRARWHCFGFNRSLWLDSDSGMAYESDVSFKYDVGGLKIQRMRVSPAICEENQILDIGDVELICNTGIGNPGATEPADPGVFPMFTLAISRNGGQTWGRDRACGMGREGEYDVRVWWQSNGSGRKVAFRVMTSDPVQPCCVMGMRADIRGESGQMIGLGQQQRAA